MVPQPEFEKLKEMDLQYDFWEEQISSKIAYARDGYSKGDV